MIMKPAKKRLGTKGGVVRSATNINFLHRKDMGGSRKDDAPMVDHSPIYTIR
jgi:hypothetical protein